MQDKYGAWMLFSVCVLAVVSICFMIGSTLYRSNAEFECAKTEQYAAVGIYEYVCYGQRSYLSN